MEKPAGPAEKHFYKPTGELVCPFEEYAIALCTWFDEESEKHRLQLTAISTLALINTRETAALHRIDKSNPYWTPALQDVYDAVDREMTERERALASRAVIRNLVDQITTFCEANGEADFYTGDALKHLKETENTL